MKFKVKDKYFVIDIINVVLCIIMLIVSMIVILDLQNKVWLFPCVIMLGAIINILAGFKSMKQNKKGKLALFGGIILFIIALMIFFGFGGF
ncbi:MAG: hypothetical protein ACERKZ_10165 [Lachnotalea sp.]